MPSQVLFQVKSKSLFGHFWDLNKAALGFFQLASSGLITEYSTVIMDPAVSLLHLRQGNRTIEDYVAENSVNCVIKWTLVH